MNPVSLYALLLVALMVKHLIADLPLQTTSMALNKGTYGHRGGLYHAGIHGLASIAALWLFSPYLSPRLALLIVALEVVVHYHIDFIKMNLDNLLNYSQLVRENNSPTSKPTGRLITHIGYYYLLVIDQALHFLTYIAMGWLIITYS